MIERVLDSPDEARFRGTIDKADRTVVSQHE